MPVAIHQQQLIMPLWARVWRAARIAASGGRFPLRRRNVHPPLKAFRHPLRILLQLADLPLTENLSGRQIHAPTERQIASPASSVTIRPLFPASQRGENLPKDGVFIRLQKPQATRGP